MLEGSGSADLVSYTILYTTQINKEIKQVGEPKIQCLGGVDATRPLPRNWGTGEFRGDPIVRHAQGLDQKSKM